MTDPNTFNQYSFNNTPTNISSTNIVEEKQITPVPNNTYPNKDHLIPIEAIPDTNPTPEYFQKKSKLITTIGIILMAFSFLMLLLRLVFIK